jgi:VWFA-related protein
VVLAALLVGFALADAGNVRISTMVTDRQGRPVAGLTAKDFEIREDGVLQRIEAVEPREPEARRLAILLDEFHVDPADSAAVREALTRFVDERLRAGDSAVVVKPLDSLPSIKLTTDRDALRRAIASFEGRKGLYEPRTPLEDETLGRAPALVEAGRAQVVLSALRALASQLGTERGRSAILIVTEGFTAQPRRSMSRGLPDPGMVERFANRYDVPIYAFDPRATHDESDAGSVTLSRLVTETGGTLSRGPDLAVNVARAASELDGGYTLVYTSAHGDDGRYHPVQVTIARREADARARAGYVSAPSVEMRRALRSLTNDGPSAPPRQLRRSPLVQVWSGVTNMSATGATIAVTWEPGAGAGLGRSPATRVAVTAKTPDGKLLYQGMLAPVRTGGPGAADSDRAEFGAPIGRVQIDMTVLGAGGEKIDTDVRDLEIPVLKPDTVLLLPPIVIATQSAREFRDLAASKDAAPVPAREFRRTERLIIRVPAYTGGAAAQVSARLLNRVGQTVKELDVMPGDATGVTQFDLPLAPLAPGEYFLQFTMQSPNGPVSQRVSFKITG